MKSTQKYFLHSILLPEKIEKKWGLSPIILTFFQFLVLFSFDKAEDSWQDDYSCQKAGSHSQKERTS